MRLNYAYRISGLTAFIAASVVIFLHASGISGSLMSIFLSTWFRVRGSVQPPSSVAIVRVDEESFMALRATTMFFPRRVWAEVLKKLGEAEAASAVMDISFRGDWPVQGEDALLEQALDYVPTVLGVRGAVITGREASFNEPVVKAEFGSKAVALGHMLLGVPDTRVVSFPGSLVTAVKTWEPLFAAAAATVGREVAPSPNDYLLYYGGAGTIPGVSLKELLRLTPEELRVLVRGRVVFVGYTKDATGEVGARDKFLTPYPGEMAGVEIHATAAANAIDGRWLRPYAPNGAPLRVAAVALVGGFLIMTLSAPLSAAVALCLSAGWWGLGYWAFLKGIIIPGSELPEVMLPTWVFRLAWDQVRHAELLMGLQIAFRCLLPKEMAKRLIADPAAMEGSRRKEVTLLFSDIEGFTSYSENASDTELNSFVDLYDTALDEAVTEEGGFIIDFAGDGMLALFGAPLNVSDPTAAAFRAVQKIRNKLCALALREGFPVDAPLKTRFGINAGAARVGIIGAKNRRYYRALGDAVNLGSRIMELNSRLGTTLLFPKNLCPALGSSDSPISMGSFKLRGREMPVDLCTILPDPPSMHDSENWECALRAFQAQQFEEARRYFELVSGSSAGLEKAAFFYLNRLNRLEKAPRGEGWTGVVESW